MYYTAGREFLDTYKKPDGLDNEYLEIMLQAKSKGANVDILRQLIFLKSKTELSKVTCLMIGFLEKSFKLQDLYELRLDGKAYEFLNSLYNHIAVLNRSEQSEIAEFFQKVIPLYQSKKNYDEIKIKENAYKIAIVLGVINASSVVFDDESINLNQDDSSFSALNVVFNSGFEDARVVKTAKSIVANNPNSIVIGYDIKNKYTSTFKKCHDGINYFVLGNIRAIYINLLKVMPTWEEKYRIQQLLFCAFSLTVAKCLYKGPSHSYTLIYSHDMHSIAIGRMLKDELKKCESIKWVHDFHEYVAGVEFNIEDRKIFFVDDEKNNVNDIDQAVTVSPGLSKLLNENYSLNPLIVYNSNTSDRRPKSERYISLKKHLKLDEDSPLIIYSGGITPQRRVGLPLAALKEIKNLHYCIITNDTVDSNSELKRIMEEAGKLKVKDRIHFHPYVEADKAWELMVGATACLSMLPRYANGDIALPNKLFDSLKAGTPFLTSSTPELDAFINKYKCGAVFEADNPSSFVNSLKLLIEKPISFQPSEFDEFSWDHAFSVALDAISKKKIEMKLDDKIISTRLIHEGAG